MSLHGLPFGLTLCLRCEKTSYKRIFHNDILYESSLEMLSREMLSREMDGVGGDRNEDVTSSPGRDDTTTRALDRDQFTTTTRLEENWYIHHQRYSQLSTFPKYRKVVSLSPKSQEIMVLKRKRSTTTLSTFETPSHSQWQDTTAVLKMPLIFPQTKPIEPFYQTLICLNPQSPLGDQSESPHLNSRTRKRHRDDRPDEQQIHGEWTVPTFFILIFGSRFLTMKDSDDDRKAVFGAKSTSR